MDQVVSASDPQGLHPYLPATTRRAPLPPNARTAVLHQQPTGRSDLTWTSLMSLGGEHCFEDVFGVWDWFRGGGDLLPGDVDGDVLEGFQRPH